MQTRMNSERSGVGPAVVALGALVAWIMLCIGVAVGWIMNIVDLAGMAVITGGEGILRIVGIFVFPLGAFMGWFF